MKYVKILGLAVVAAMALMAFLGAGTASATKLCKTTDTPHCTAGWHYNEGTVIKTSLKAGTSAVLSDTGGSLRDECAESTTEGATTNTGSETETVDGKVEAAKLTWGKCTAEKTETLKGGLLEIHWIEGTHNGTVTAKEFEVTVKVFGVSCIYKAGAGIHLGELTSGPEPILHVNTVVQGSGGFLCPSTGTWKATYVVTSPTPLYVTTG